MYGWQTRWFLPGCQVGMPMWALFSGLGKNDKANGSLRVRCISKSGRYLPVTLLTRDGDHGPGELKTAPSTSLYEATASAIYPPDECPVTYKCLSGNKSLHFRK